MTIEQVEKGNSILQMLHIWEKRYTQYVNRGLLYIDINRNGCDTVEFDGSGNHLSAKFFNEVELMYGELCKKQIELLTKELEAL